MFTKDKLYHLIVGFAIGVLFGFFNPLVGIFTATGAGVGKELYDKYIKKSFADPLDTIATTVGGILGAGLAILITNTL